MRKAFRKQKYYMERMAVRVVHVVVVAWIFIGSIAVWLFPFYTMIHVALVGLTGASQRYFGVCPLTKLENRLRVNDGLPPFKNGCIQHTTGVPEKVSAWLLGAAIANAVVVLAINLR